MQIEQFPKDPHFKFFHAAYIAALLSPGTGGKTHANFRLGAVIAYKKILLTAKFNSYKTHPKLLNFYKWPFLHAEANAILSLGLDNCVDNSLYILRIKKNKDIGLAKPCQACLNLITHCGIKKVFFSTEEGYSRILL